MAKKRHILISILVAALLFCSCSPKKSSEGEKDEENKKGYLVYINADTPDKNSLYNVDISDKKAEKIYEKNVLGAAGNEGKIAFVIKESGKEEIDMMNADGKDKKRITKDLSLKNQYLSWSTDKKWIAFPSKQSEDKFYNIYYIEAGKDKTYTRITDDVYDCESPLFTKEGNVILFSAGINGKHDIYSFNIQSKKITKLTNNNGDNLSPAISPDGMKLLYLSDQNSKGRYNIYMSNIDGTNPIEMTKDQSIAKDSVKVSPDNSMISFITVGKNGNRSINIIDMNKASIFISNGGYISTWSKDSKKLYYASFDNQYRKIIEYNIEDKTSDIVLRIQFKPGEENTGIKFLHYTDKLK